MDHWDSRAVNDEVRAAWDANAAYWDETIGEGNAFVELLVWPAVQRLLGVRQGEQVLDIACGNGLYARRLAALGASVLAVDLSEEMVARARAYPEHAAHIEYRVVDATDTAALLTLGEQRFHAAICPMALMDMAAITPLMAAVARLLRPGGRFVFAVSHPCFNHAGATQVAELAQEQGRFRTVYGVKVWKYLTPSFSRGVALLGQPRLQPYLDRPLHALLGAGFAAGLVLDGLEEPAFPPEFDGGKTPLSWNGNFSEIPPALVGRFRAIDADRLMRYEVQTAT